MFTSQHRIQKGLIQITAHTTTHEATQSVSRAKGAGSGRE